MDYNRETLNKEIVNLCEYFNHSASKRGVDILLDEFDRNKGEYLIPMLSKHPNWDAENLRIVFSQDYERRFNIDGIQSFLSWVLSVYPTEFRKANEVTIFGKTYGEYIETQKLADRYLDAIDKLKCVNRLLNLGITQQTKIGAFTLEQLELLRHTFEAEGRDIYMQFESCSWNNYRRVNPYTVHNNAFFTREDGARYSKFHKFVDKFMYCDYPEHNRVTEKHMQFVLELFPDIKTGVGTTITKLFRKIFTEYFPEILNYDEVDVSSWIDGNGEYNEREKRINLESKLSELGDAISPLKIKRHTIISVNPLDYLTMSFGHNWASCQTIDKENERGVEDNHYSGCYCSGTLSYMLDKSSVVFYTVDERYDGTEFETQDKMQRCMFHISEDGNRMVQGRAYPDARDIGDFSYAKQFREVMQKVISDCLDRPNFWTNKKGTGACCEVVISKGTHYRDYEHYSDCNVSVRQNAELLSEYIYIGHRPIDPCTGEEHDEEGYLNGDSHSNQSQCFACDTWFNYEMDGYYCEDNGRYYCCRECADADNVHYCEDDYNLHTENYCFRDNYDEEWYSGDPYVITEDGNTYSSESNAQDDGYLETSDGYWYPEEDCVEVNGEWYLERDDRIVCTAFYSEWILKANAVAIIDGKYYGSEEEANEDGYAFNAEFGEWVLIDEATEIVSENNSESEVA